jgi:hypothetical protein
MKKPFAILVMAMLTTLPAPALAWNEHGHMVVARLAWRQLTEDQRAKVSAILKKHPHYDEYLAARKPDGFTEDEWAFMRAAAWPDWVRGKRDFDHPTWHFINYPVVPPGSSVKAAAAMHTKSGCFLATGLSGRLGRAMRPLARAALRTKSVLLSAASISSKERRRPLRSSERIPTDALKLAAIPDRKQPAEELAFAHARRASDMGEGQA